MSDRFAGKIVLATAGASGIGAATCEAFSRQGATVMVADINEERGREVVEKLIRDGRRAAFCQVDATNEEDAARMVRLTVETFGGLHIAANVVGLMHAEAGGTMLHLNSIEGWQTTVDCTLKSVFLSCKHEIAHMIDAGGGSIVNVASVGGIRHIPEAGAAYSAAKAAVIHFTRFAALSYAQHAIRINALAPGVTLTPAYPAAAAATYPDLSPEDALAKFIPKVIDGHAIKRAVDSHEQANAIVWLSSEEAAMVTGHTLPVDGGWSAR